MPLLSLPALLLSTLFSRWGSARFVLSTPFRTGLGFTSVEIGFSHPAIFAGFLLGCIFSPYLVRRAGHSRAFAVMAGAAVISIIAHPILPDAMFWTAIRVLSGFSVAGCYT
ncbi:MAG: hypothetical protein CM15mP115_24980 [Alphaproteobacteria bacterium]|nr:MAG: hypothetical protein CM15mP115_24980 [Alphaproteobacteria bacterium]